MPVRSAHDVYYAVPESLQGNGAAGQSRACAVSEKAMVGVVVELAESGHRERKSAKSPAC